MSKDIIILIPNGRRIKVHCTPDTSFLQVLEDVCEKQGYEASEYNLKHHNHIVDLTTTIRFCNIPNKATLEMVEADKKRVEANVTVGLLLDDGERRTAEFAPHTYLFDLVTSLADNELSTMKNPTIMYMRQEVIGISALKEKTLRQLGLIAGRAVLRLLDKTETTQANVSSVYRAKPEKPKTEDVNNKEPINMNTQDLSGTSGEEQLIAAHKDKDMKSIDPVKLYKSLKIQQQHSTTLKTDNIAVINNSEQNTEIVNRESVTATSSKRNLESKAQKKLETQDELERRLKIEEEVTFVGSQKAIAFMQPEESHDELSDLPDDFYELSIEEVRKIYHELQQKRIEFENTPLLTSTKREELEKQVSQQKINTYRHVVVRIQFPDNMILQGVFTPSNTIKDVNNFVKEHLQNQDKEFQIFTTPLKESLDPDTTLLDAKYVPCVHMHFRWLEENSGQSYLKDDIYLKQTSSDAASILASKYRAPTRRKLEETQGSSNNKTSTSKESKLPKWFKK
ncbi:unnamed protein product [Colias eurytheme]|nr:unnamed protein product [Colias eurytheme]